MMLTRPSYVDAESMDAASASSAELSDPRLQQALSHLLGAADAVQTAFDDGAIELRFQVCVWLEDRFYKVLIVEAPEQLGTGRPQLSPRERDIARLIAKGLTNKAIARVLFLRPSTVSTYAKRLFLKLNVSSRAEMVAKVLSEDLLERAS